MKRALLLFSLMFLLLISVHAQDQDKEIALPDAIMQQVVNRIVTFYFKPRRSPTTIYFSDRNLKPEWLPKIQNIRFEVVKNDRHPTAQKGYVFSSIDRDGKYYTIGFGYGDLGCGEVWGKTWNFTIRGSKVRLLLTHGVWGESCDEDAAIATQPRLFLSSARVGGACP